MRRELIWAAATCALLAGCQDASRQQADESVDMALMEPAPPASAAATASSSAVAPIVAPSIANA